MIRKLDFHVQYDGYKPITFTAHSSQWLELETKVSRYKVNDETVFSLYITLISQVMQSLVPFGITLTCVGLAIKKKSKMFAGGKLLGITMTDFHEFKHEWRVNGLMYYIYKYIEEGWQDQRRKEKQNYRARAKSPQRAWLPQFYQALRGGIYFSPKAEVHSARLLFFLFFFLLHNMMALPLPVLQLLPQLLIEQPDRLIHNN